VRFNKSRLFRVGMITETKSESCCEIRFVTVTTVFS
jgi:hypothetical protein